MVGNPMSSLPMSSSSTTLSPSLLFCPPNPLYFLCDSTFDHRLPLLSVPVPPLCVWWLPGVWGCVKGTEKALCLCVLIKEWVGGRGGPCHSEKLFVPLYPLRPIDIPSNSFPPLPPSVISHLARRRNEEKNSLTLFPPHIDSRISYAGILLSPRLICFSRTLCPLSTPTV